MCDKKSYDTYYEAEKVLSMVRTGRTYKYRRLATKKPKRVYKCEECGNYHLTSQVKAWASK